MSWNAHLTDDLGVGREDDWNYTHNCNGMIAAALEAVGDAPVEMCSGPLGKVIGPAWWDRLDGLSGPMGAALLNRIVRGLRGDPGRFRAMNPSNGWGDYDSLLNVLCEMRDAVPEWPTTWSVNG